MPGTEEWLNVFIGLGQTGHGLVMVVGAGTDLGLESEVNTPDL
jgi:hypothetical protein